MTVQIVHRRGALESQGPAIMGILNVTPDSFSDGGRHNALEDALSHARRLISQGAHIIDVGGESTRPGAEHVATEEELRRTIPVIERLRAESDVVISIDTTKADVAEAALDAGADIVNDISGGLFEPQILSVAARHSAGYVAMHTTGRPKVMSARATYQDVVTEVRDHLAERADAAQASGIERGRICLDPGFGFGKTPAQNYELLANFDQLSGLGYPVLVGVSRKRMIRHLTGPAEDRIEHGNTAMHALATRSGAAILRVHEPAFAAIAIAASIAVDRRS